MQDRYEPSEQVTIVGYTQGCLSTTDKASASNDRPLYGYLHADTSFDGSRERPTEPTDGIPLGRFTLEEPSHEQLGQRMSLTFTLPADLPPGAYYVEICLDPCSSPLTGENLHVAAQGWPSWPIHVGVDPPECWRLVRYWPPDDPAVHDLPDDALLLVDGHPTTIDGQVTTVPTCPQATIVEEAPAAATNQDNAAGRTKTGAPVPEDNAAHNNNLQSILWLVAAALLLLTWRATSRLGPTRKQIRQKR